MNDIKNIIFDLGGVVINLDRSMAIHALETLGVKDVSALLGEYSQKGPFLLHETGEITTSELFDILLKYCRKDTSCTDIRDAFEQFLRGLPVQRLQTIRQLREKGYKVFVLSNTNPLMYNHWIDNAFRAEGLTINDYFDGIVLSFQERVCKPDTRIFQNLIKRYHLIPQETILLDDSKANCEAAESIGLNAVRIMPSGEDSFMSVCDKLMQHSPAE